MYSGSSPRKDPKRPRRRTTSLLPMKTLFELPTPLGITIPVSLEREEAHGSFTPTSPAFPCLANFVMSNHHGDYTRRRQNSMFEWNDSHSDNNGGSDISSVPPSPTSSFQSSVPCIARTSSYTTASSSSSMFDESVRPVRPTRIGAEMNPILSELERKSKLCSFKAGCATCGKRGSDYPRCGKCGEMWCSRPCRLRGGKKHICARTNA